MCVTFGEKQNKHTKNKHKRIRKISVPGHKRYSQSIMASVSACSTAVTLILPLSPNYCFLSKGMGESVLEGTQRGSQEPGTTLKATIPPAGSCRCRGTRAKSVATSPLRPLSQLLGSSGAQAACTPQGPHAAGHRQPPARCPLFTLPHSNAQEQLVPMAAESLRL